MIMMIDKSIGFVVVQFQGNLPQVGFIVTTEIVLKQLHGSASRLATSGSM